MRSRFGEKRQRREVVLELGPWLFNSIKLGLLEEPTERNQRMPGALESIYSKRLILQGKKINLTEVEVSPKAVWP